jgi:hypothetical protein
MAFLTDPGVPCPPSSTQLALLFDRIEWLIVVPFAVILIAIVLLQGSIAGRERTDTRGMGVCEQRTFLTPNFFFLALH